MKKKNFKCDNAQGMLQHFCTFIVKLKHSAKSCNNGPQYLQSTTHSTTLFTVLHKTTIKNKSLYKLLSKLFAIHTHLDE